jgi:hypothetical protein
MMACNRRRRIVGDLVVAGSTQQCHIAGTQPMLLAGVGDDPRAPAHDGGQGQRRPVLDPQRPRRA